MSESDVPDKEILVKDGKNNEILFCLRCPCKILNKGLGTFKEIKFTLPLMNYKAEEDMNSEDISEYWQVSDIYSFENIGFSKTVSGLKYLICADCEIGPIGWHDVNSKESYVALSRVKYSVGK